MIKYVVNHKLLKSYDIKAVCNSDEACINEAVENLLIGNPLTIPEILLALGWICVTEEIVQIVNNGNLIEVKC